MKNIKVLFSEFIDDESGLTAVEYAIAGALVAGVLVVAFSELGTAVASKIDCLGSVVGGTRTDNC